MENTVLRRSPKQARGQQRIEAILAAAAQLFDEIGYEATSTVLIAKRAKTAVGSLYDFFPNKESIAAALVERFTTDLHGLLDSLLTQEVAALPLDQTLELLIDPLTQFIHTRSGFRALYLEAPHIGQMSQAQQSLEALLNERVALLLRLRYPEARNLERIAQVCMETVKALTGLAIRDGHIDPAVLSDLKLMLRAFLQARFDQ